MLRLFVLVWFVCDRVYNGVWPVVVDCLCACGPRLSKCACVFCVCFLCVFSICCFCAALCLRGLCVFVCFVCVCCVLRVLRVTYGAMVCGLYVGVVSCFFCVRALLQICLRGVCMFYCALLYGSLFVLCCNCACGF